MEILYQIPGDIATGPLGPGELDRRAALLNDWASQDCKVFVRDSAGGPLSIESAYEEAICVRPMLESVSKVDFSPDAVIVGCFSDPGLWALREVADCPVIGPLEASLHLAAQLGSRVGIVTVLERVVPLLEARVRESGMSAFSGGIGAVEVPVLELRARPERLVERMSAAALQLMHSSRADVICLGCMTMSFLGLAEKMNERLPVPVINPARVALETASTAVRMQITHSGETYPKPKARSPVTE